MLPETVSKEKDDVQGHLDMPTSGMSRQMIRLHRVGGSGHGYAQDLRFRKGGSRAAVAFEALTTYKSPLTTASTVALWALWALRLT